MGNFLRTDYSEGWQPSADPFNAPKNSALRMDNLMLDEVGALSLRQGSVKINPAAFSDVDVHSLFTTSLSGSRYRMSGATNAVYANGTSIASGLAGSGDISFGAHMGQILFARSTSKKKFDGSTVRTWGIAAPASAPTLAVTAQSSTVFASCASSELPIMVTNEGSQSFVTDRFGVATEAVQIAPDATTGRGQSTKTFTAAKSFDGSDDDLIECFVKIAEPQYITGITLMWDVLDGTFQSDYYQTSFLPADVAAIVSTGQESLNSNYDVEGFERERIEAALEQRDQSETLYVQSAAGWNHFSIARGKISRVGLTPGRNWSTVMAVRLVVTAIAGGSGAAVIFDQLQVIQGGFTGKYTARVVAAYDNGTYVALSGPSAISNEIEVFGQGLTVSVDQATITALDPQVTALWVYLMGGRLNAFYRFAVQTITFVSTEFDYTSAFESAYFTSVSGLANYTQAFEVDYGGTIGPKSHNYTFEERFLSGSDPLLINITESEITALAANIRLETDNTIPPDSIIGIEGPHYDRTLCLTATHIYPSRQLNPDSYATGEAVRVGSAIETALWIKALGRGNLYVGTTRDVYEFDGDWTVLPDGSINVVKRPLHVSEPPVSAAVEVGTINGVETLIYLSGDGWHGLGLGPLVNNAVDLLWRGFTRHGVSYANITDTSARFRCAVAKNVMFALTPEGASTTSTSVIHAYHFGKQRWYRFTYPQAFRSILAEPDGTVIAGDGSGFVRLLDLATKQDDGVDIPVILWTPVDDNGQPFTSKAPENLWMRLDTGGNTATVAFHLNGNDAQASSSTTVQAQTDTENMDVTSVPECSQLQLRITGNFSTFVFRGWSLRYLDYPIGQMIHDTGFVDLSGDILKWVKRIRFKARALGDMTVTPYWDGSAGSGGTVNVSTYRGQPTVYELPLSREDRGKVGRVVITTTQPSNVYWVEFIFNGTGKQLQKRITLIPEAA